MRAIHMDALESRRGGTDRVVLRPDLLVSAAVLCWSIPIFAQIPETGACAISPPNKVSWWSLDEIEELEGPVVYDLAGTNIGSLGGDPELVAGKVGNALGFDGLDNYVDVADTSTLNIPEPCTEPQGPSASGACGLTVEAWIQTTLNSGIQPLWDKRGDVPGPSDQIFADGFESGNVSRWSGHVGASDAAIGVPSWLGRGTGAGDTEIRHDLSDDSHLQGYYFFVANGFLGVQLADAGGVRSHVSPGYVADGLWHHVAVSLARSQEGQAGLIFLDGRQVLAFDPGRSDLTNGADLWIGKAHTLEANLGNLPRMNVEGSLEEALDPDEFPQRFFQGAMDEVALYDRALGQQEIQKVFQAGGAGSCKSSSACRISFRDGELDPGDSFVDYSGSHGALPCGNYRMTISQTGDFMITNLQGTWNGRPIGVYQPICPSARVYYSGVIPIFASPGQSVTVKFEIYNILGQLVCSGSPKISVKTPCHEPCPSGGVYDLANCYMYSVPGNEPFIWQGNFYYQPVWHPNGLCPHEVWNNFTNVSVQPWFDGANCYIGSANGGPNPFIFDGNYYISASPGPDPCPYGGVFDGANCYVYTWPGVKPFVWQGNFYYQPLWHPDGLCPHEAHNNFDSSRVLPWFDGANCVVGLNPGNGQQPFIYGNNYYLTPVCRP